MYDYIAYAWLILVFFVFILLSIVLVKRSALISVLLLFFSLGILFIGPFVLKHYLDEYFRSSSVVIENHKKLHFSDIMIINGHISNHSNNSFHICDLSVAINKTDTSKLQKILNKLKPFRKKTILLQENIDVNSTAPFRMVIENYTYEKDVNVSAKAVCY